VKTTTMPFDQWLGYIKDYEGGTLMECEIYRNINYLDIPGMLRAQRICVMNEIRKVSQSHIIHKGLPYFPRNNLDVSDV